MYKLCKNSHLFFFIKYNKCTCYLNTTLLTIYLFVNTEFILVVKSTPHRQDPGLCCPVPLPLAHDLERVKCFKTLTGEKLPSLLRAQYDFYQSSDEQM